MVSKDDKNLTTFAVPCPGGEHKFFFGLDTGISTSTSFLNYRISDLVCFPKLKFIDLTRRGPLACELYRFSHRDRGHIKQSVDKRKLEIRLVFCNVSKTNSLRLRRLLSSETRR